MLDRKEDSTDLNKFKENLKLQTVWLSYIADRFWPIERIFTRDTNKKLCEQFLAKVDNVNVSTIPATSECIQWKYNPVSQAWDKTTHREAMNSKEYNNRLLVFKQVGAKCREQGKSKLLADFLERQRKYYARESSPVADEKVDNAELINQLNAIDCLISGSSAAIANKITRILKLNKQLTVDVCADIAVTVFVGRYLIDKQKPDVIELLPIVNKYLDNLAESCFKMHARFHTPQLITIQVTQEEFDMIVQKRSAAAAMRK